MKMPFGKHEDKELTEIPKGYLRWLRSQDWLSACLSNAVAEALGEPVPERSQKPWHPSEGEPWECGYE
jgi:Putative quorum-sensing-regulated virulence factor